MKVPRILWILLLILAAYFFLHGAPSPSTPGVVKFEVISAKWSGPYVTVVLKNAGDEIRPRDLSFSTEKGECKPEGVPTIPPGDVVSLKLVCPSGSRFITVRGGAITVTQRIT